MLDAVIIVLLADRSRTNKVNQFSIHSSDIQTEALSGEVAAGRHGLAFFLRS